MKSRSACALVITIFVLGHAGYTIQAWNGGARTLFLPIIKNNNVLLPDSDLL